jgi:hypothetical protein
MLEDHLRVPVIEKLGLICQRVLRGLDDNPDGARSLAAGCRLEIFRLPFLNHNRFL